MVYRVKTYKRHVRSASTSPAQSPTINGKQPPTTQVDKLAQFFFRKSAPLPELDHPDEAQPTFESYFVDKVVYYELGIAETAHTTIYTACNSEGTALNLTSSIAQTKYPNVTN